MKLDPRNSLRGRLVTLGGALLLLFTLLTGFALEVALTRYTERAEYERLQGLVFAILGAMDVKPDGRVEISEGAIPEPRLTQLDSGLGVIVFDASGTPLWRSAGIDAPTSLDDPPQVNEWRFSAGTRYRLSYGIEWELNRNRHLRYTVTVDEGASPLQTQREQFTRQLWGWLGFSTLLLLLTLLALMRWVIRPLRLLTWELDDIRDGRKDQLTTAVPEEIQPLAQGLNTLLQHQHQQQARFRDALADLAHSLKTPLTVLRGQLRDHPDAVAAEQIERMEQIIGYQLQRAATVGAKALHPPQAVRPVAERLINALRKVYADKGVAFRLDIPPGFRLAMDPGDLMELLGNLLDNAAKYCTRQVLVRAESRPTAQLLIDDDGPGFPEHAEQLLTRGARADTREAGQGIGLAVTQDIVRAYGATLSLRRGPLGGARVVVTMAR